MECFARSKRLKERGFIMTLEQKEKLEKMLHYFSMTVAICEKDNKLQEAFVNRDRIRQIQEVLEVLGYKTNKELRELSSYGRFYYVYTITG